MEKNTPAATGFLGRKRVLAANLILLALVAWGFAGELSRNRDLKKDIERLESQAQRLENENFEIARIGQRFAASDALEREARLNLGLQKPGESVIIIKETTPPAPAEKQPAAGIEEVRQRESNALKWWRYFFHHQR